MPSHKRITRRRFIRQAGMAAGGLSFLPVLSSCGKIEPLGGAQPPDRPRRPVPDSRHLRLLTGALGESDYVVQADAARLLGELGARQAVLPLVRYVTTSRRYAKTAGLDALAKIGDPAACPRIRHLVDNPNCFNDHYWYGYQSVRIAAAISLLALGDESGAPFLAKKAEEKNWPLFSLFAPALLGLPDRLESVRKLKSACTAEAVMPPGKSDPGQIVIIARALGMMGGGKAVARLKALLSFHSRYVRARAALNLLKAAPEARHRRMVAEMAEKDPAEFVRIKAGLALALCGEKKYVPAIAGSARTAADRIDRAGAVECLGLLRDRELVPFVLDNMEHQDPWVRQCAVEALDRIGGPEAARAIAASADDPDIRVRLQAARFLAGR